MIPQNMTFSDWVKLVDEMSADYTPIYVPVGISDGHLNNSFTVPTDSGSAWVRYKNYLLGTYGGMAVNTATSTSKYIVNL